MGKYLIFQIYGNLVAWGKPALGELRQTYAYPTKSAILGLIAAALGLPRENEEAHQSLSNSFNMGLKICRQSIILTDYHTVQPVSKNNLLTRKQEVSFSKKNGDAPILTTREYQQDSGYLVGIWHTASSLQFNLEEIAQALRMPKFLIYFGRKCCPPCLPLAPQIIESETLEEAFSYVQLPPILQPKGETVTVTWEGEGQGYNPDAKLNRQDKLINRQKWTFSERVEYYSHI